MSRLVTIQHVLANWLPSDRCDCEYTDLDDPCPTAENGPWHVLDGKRTDRLEYGASDYEGIVQSIDECGFVRPFPYVRDAETGKLMIVDGHHRLAAAIDLGLTHIPVTRVRYVLPQKDSGEWAYGKPIAKRYSAWH